MPTFLKTAGAKVWALLRHEPLSVWGTVDAAVITGLSLAGVPATDLALATGILAALGLPIVRGAVTPLAALEALLAGLGPKAGGQLIHVELLHQSTGTHRPRTGRHIVHDPRSRHFPVDQHLDAKAPLVSKQWTRRASVLNQGQIGSCTGNAAAGWVGTDNAARPGLKSVHEALALKLYGLATQLDSVPGTYPPTDTGSSGLAVAKALKQLGYATKYTHAFTLDAALRAISQLGPVLLGISWHDASFTPDPDGRVRITGPVDGGHEIIADGIDVEGKRVWCTNSWARSWGDAGRFYLTFDDLAALLKQGGDVTVPIA